MRRILEQTAKDLGPRGRDNEYGAGLVDAYQAIRALEANAAAGPQDVPQLLGAVADWQSKPLVATWRFRSRFRSPCIRFTRDFPLLKQRVTGLEPFPGGGDQRL